MNVKPPSDKQSDSSNSLREKLLTYSAESTARALENDKDLAIDKGFGEMVGVPSSGMERARYMADAPSDNPMDLSDKLTDLLSKSKHAPASRDGTDVTPVSPDDRRAKDKD